VFCESNKIFGCLVEVFLIGIYGISLKPTTVTNSPELPV
jgi:hypothetical protein